MKLFKLIFSLIAIILIGGFGYFALTDIPVEQKQIVKTIPNERFFNDN